MLRPSLLQSTQNLAEPYPSNVVGVVDGLTVAETAAVAVSAAALASAAFAIEPFVRLVDAQSQADRTFPVLQTQGLNLVYLLHSFCGSDHQVMNAKQHSNQLNVVGLSRLL
jgi:hypothetical protein